MTIETFKRVKKSYGHRFNKSTPNKPFSHFPVGKDINKGNWKEAEIKGEDDPVVEMVAIFLGGCAILLVFSIIIIVLL